MIIKRTALLALSLSASVLSWGYSDNGHKIVSQLAWDRLSPYAKQNVERILGPGRDKFVEASTWADDIKSDERFNYLKRLHYVNLPRDAKSYDQKRDCADNKCVVEAIHEFSKVVVSGSDKEQILALRMLVHLIGDIHQPLHAGLADDRGGNWFQLKYKDDSTNLHKLWDSNLVDRIDADWKKAAKKLSGQVPEAVVGNPKKWAEESHQLALKVAYATNENEPVSQRYLMRATQVNKERLQLAGWRLAMWLNKLW